MSLLAGTTIYPTKLLQKIIFTKIIPYVKFAQNLQRRKRVLHEKSYLGKTADIGGVEQVGFFMENKSERAVSTSELRSDLGNALLNLLNQQG